MSFWLQECNRTVGGVRENEKCVSQTQDALKPTDALRLYGGFTSMWSQQSIFCASIFFFFGKMNYQYTDPWVYQYIHNFVWKMLKYTHLARGVNTRFPWQPVEFSV